MRIENLCKSYDRAVLEDFSLDIEENTITCITGPSGCGKTTLLNLISGLDKPDSGTVTFEDSPKVSYLFQEPRLLPWKTVLQNVAIPLKNDMKKAKEAIEMVGLGDSMDKYPSELSGGMKQRVAIARAFSYSSGTILMDEPFQSLDIRMRNSLLVSFLDMWDRSRKTVIWVTHDITEACLAADRILVASPRPMKIIRDMVLEKEKSLRTAENTALTQALIYQTLVQ